MSVEPRELPQRSTQRLSLASLLGLVACIALGCALCVAYYRTMAILRAEIAARFPQAAGGLTLVRGLRYTERMNQSVLPVAPLALWVVLMTRARSLSERRWAEPGVAAALVTLLVIALVGLSLLCAQLPGFPGIRRVGPQTSYIAMALLPMSLGPASASAWLALGLAGAFRFEPTWPSRVGRVLGVYWNCSAVRRTLTHFARLRAFRSGPCSRRGDENESKDRRAPDDSRRLVSCFRRASRLVTGRAEPRPGDCRAPHAPH